MKPQDALALAAGSVGGGFARYFLGSFIHKILGTAFPFGTLAVNLIGCYLIGLFAVLAGDRGVLGQTERLFLMTGFCGAFTTFSAFMLETDMLSKHADVTRVFLYIALSLVLGFVFFRLGSWTAKLV